MKNIGIFDCTLSEGLYENNFLFGSNVISSIINELSDSGLDIVEIGRVSEKFKGDDYTYITKEHFINNILNKNRIYSVYLSESVKDISIIKLYKNIVDIIRYSVYWDKNKKDKFIENIKYIADNKYKVFLQIENIEDISNEELHSLLSEIDEKIYILGINSKNISKEQYNILFNVLKDDILIALNMDFSKEFIKKYFEDKSKKHNILIYSSVMGIGFNYGTVKTELLTIFLNKLYKRKYKIENILFIADKYIEILYNEYRYRDTLNKILLRNNNKNIEYNRYYSQECKLSSIELNEIINLLKKDYSKKYASIILKYFRKKFFGSRLAILISLDNIDISKIENYLERLEKYNVDISYKFYTKIFNENIKQIVNKHNKKYRRNYAYKSGDERFLLENYYMNYKYIWICDGCWIPNIKEIYVDLLYYTKKNYDFILVNNLGLDFNKSIKYECDNNYFIKSNYFRMFNNGMIIYSYEKIMDILDIKKEKKEMDFKLIRSFMLYLTYNKKIKVNYINNGLIFYDEFNFYKLLNPNNKDFLILWIDNWIKFIEKIPFEYKNLKKDLYKIDLIYYKLFSITTFLDAVYNNNLKRKNIKLLKKQMNLITNFNVINCYIFSYLPKFLAGFLIKNKTSIITRFFKYIYLLFRGIYQSIKNYNKKYDGIYYEKYIDCIKEKKNIKSYLLYGDENYIKNPLITIVIPTYKRGPLILETLKSIFRQKEVDFKWNILIIDNEDYEGIPNNTEKIVKKLDDKRILYYRNEKNLGPGGNYNRGIELANGEYVALLHDDDLIINTYLQRIGKRIKRYSKKNKKIGYISIPHQYFKSGNLLSDKNILVELYKIEKSINKEIDRERLYKVKQSELAITGGCGIYLPSCGTIMNRQAVLEYGGFNDNLGICADMVLPYRLMKEYGVYRNDTILGFYRWNNNISTAPDTNFKVEKFLFNFREYVYKKNIIYFIFGELFRHQHFYQEVKNLIIAGKWAGYNQKLEDFNKILIYEPNRLKNKMFSACLFIYKIIQRIDSCINGNKKYIFYYKIFRRKK